MRYGVLRIQVSKKPKLEKELRKHPHEVVDVNLLEADKLYPREFRDYCYDHYINRINTTFKDGESAVLDDAINTKD